MKDKKKEREKCYVYNIFTKRNPKLQVVIGRYMWQKINSSTGSN